MSGTPQGSVWRQPAQVWAVASEARDAAAVLVGDAA